MTDDYKRCDTCIHHNCAPKGEGYCEGCPMWKLEEEIPEHDEGCGCVAYNFDIDGDCPFYEKYGGKINGAQ